MASVDPDQPAFDDEDDDLDDTDGDDTDMDDDEEDDASASAAASDPHAPPLPPHPTPTAATDPNSNPDLLPDPTPAPQNGTIEIATIAGGDLKRPRIEERRPPPSSSLDDSRRLFQRLWTDEDEIKILSGFLEFTASRGTQFASHQYDTGPFYEQIKNQLELDFNKNQLIEKLRRLKKKYRNTANRMASHGNSFTFKSSHEQATYEIARKIWSASIKRSRESDEDDLNPYYNNNNTGVVVVARSSDRRGSRSRRRSRKRSLDSLPAATPVMLALPQPPPPPPLPWQPQPQPQPQRPPPPLPPPASGSSEGVVKVEVQTAPAIAPVVQNPRVIEETVKSCLSPIFRELLNSAVSAPFGLGVNLLPLLNFGGSLGSLSSDERWKQQQVLELEVYLKRVELIRDQIKSTLEELKASHSVAGS